jgi:sarcosine oxidase
VPLLRRAYDLWRELEWESGERLLHITGSIDAGPPESPVFAGSVESCCVHGLPHEVLTAREVAARFPGYRLPGSAMAVMQPDGGFLLPERCIVAHVLAAQRLGAEVHGRERVLGWEPDGRGVVVTTERGRYSADRLVVCAGAWTAGILPALAPLAVPERQVLAWLQPRRPDLFQPGRFPVFNVLVDEGRYYGLPVFGVPGFKVGRYHHLGEQVDPDAMDRSCTTDDERVLRGFAERYFPEGAGPTMALKVCLFTNSPDEHFIIDQLPDSLVVAAGFSGHGYKFCSVVGEILADLCIDGSTRHDISLFGLDRFH